MNPFTALIAAKQLIAYPHQGFWACMDASKEKQHLQDLHATGRSPWRVWDAGVAVHNGSEIDVQA
jgi:glucose-1-phosphate cytidylyltransferase